MSSSIKRRNFYEAIFMKPLFVELHNVRTKKSIDEKNNSIDSFSVFNHKHENESPSVCEGYCENMTEKSDRKALKKISLKSDNYSSNNQEHISEIFSTFFPKIKSNLIKGGLSYHLAEDLAQDVFFNIVKSEICLADIEYLEPWIWTVVRNTSRSYFRKKETRISNETINDQNVLAQLTSNNDDYVKKLERFIDSCISEFRNQDKIKAEALRLRIQNDWSIKQVKEYLGKNSNHLTTVYLYVARQEFKQIIKNNICDMRLY